MCGGSPFMIASVMKILRKSWGVKARGCAGGVGEAGAGQRAAIQLRIDAAADRAVLGADAALEQQRASAGSNSRSCES